MTLDNNRSVRYFIALERLQRACKFNKEMLTFLGHVISKENISPDKVSADASLYILVPPFYISRISKNMYQGVPDHDNLHHASNFVIRLTLVLEGVKASMLCKVCCTSSLNGGVYEENAPIFRSFLGHIRILNSYWI